jgi:hypothetical protein
MPPLLRADLPQSLDAVHLEVRQAFARADLAGYARYLAPDLRYIDTRGRVQTREELLASLRRQFARLVRFRSSFARETLVASGEDVTECGVQDGNIALRLFGLFEIRFVVRRRGRFTWRRAPEGHWQLREARLETEAIHRDGFGLARPEPPERQDGA